MGPSCRSRARSTRKPSTRRTLFKKERCKNTKNQAVPPISVAISPVKPDLVNVNASDDLENTSDIPVDKVYLTPKAERFRIPEIKTCPRAPKKRRTSPGSCSLQGSPIAFYTSPEIELFFSSALHGVSYAS